MSQVSSDTNIWHEVSFCERPTGAVEAQNKLKLNNMKFPENPLAQEPSNKLNRSPLTILNNKTRRQKYKIELLFGVFSLLNCSMISMIFKSNFNIHVATKYALELSRLILFIKVSQFVQRKQVQVLTTRARSCPNDIQTKFNLFLISELERVDTSRSAAHEVVQFYFRKCVCNHLKNVTF